MDWTLHIERNPNVMMGKPVFKGTRIAVEYILERLAQGPTRPIFWPITTGCEAIMTSDEDFGER